MKEFYKERSRVESLPRYEFDKLLAAAETKGGKNMSLDEWLASEIAWGEHDYSGLPFAAQHVLEAEFREALGRYRLHLGVNPRTKEDAEVVLRQVMRDTDKLE
jgi:hypothetical protein